MTIRANDGEVLTCDWCKYNQNIITTAGTDGGIFGWDLRQPGQPVFHLHVSVLNFYGTLDSSFLVCFLPWPILKKLIQLLKRNIVALILGADPSTPVSPKIQPVFNIKYSSVILKYIKTGRC